MKIELIIRTQFESFHCWPDAPDDVSFLRFTHRHIFHVETSIAGHHLDRSLEFFQIKRNIDNFFKETVFPLSSSCEYMAAELLKYLEQLNYTVNYISIFEDNENGARISHE